MSTKTTDTNTVQYDPGSKGVYSGLQPSIGSTLTDFMKNPLTASYFNQGVGLGQKYVSQQGATGMQSLFSNMKSMGGAGSPTTMSSPFMQSMIARQGRTTSGAMANNFLQQLMQARQMQLGATGMAQGYNPLMTGSTSTQTKSGLGTWLPQVLGTAGGALMGGFGGGGVAAASSGGGGLFGSLTQGGGAMPTLGNVGAMPGSFPPPIFAGLPGF